MVDSNYKVAYCETVHCRSKFYQLGFSINACHLWSTHYQLKLNYTEMKYFTLNAKDLQIRFKALLMNYTHNFFRIFYHNIFEFVSSYVYLIVTADFSPFFFFIVGSFMSIMYVTQYHKMLFFCLLWMQKPTTHKDNG